MSQNFQSIKRMAVAKIFKKSLLKVMSATFLLVCFSRLKESNCETWKNVFFSQMLFSFSKKSNFGILDIQISLHHQMPKHKTRNIFY